MVKEDLREQMENPLKRKRISTMEESALIFLLGENPAPSKLKSTNAPQGAGRDSQENVALPSTQEDNCTATLSEETRDSKSAEAETRGQGEGECETKAEEATEERVEGEGEEEEEAWIEGLPTLEEGEWFDFSPESLPWPRNLPMKPLMKRIAQCCRTGSKSEKEYYVDEFEGGDDPEERGGEEQREPCNREIVRWSSLRKAHELLTEWIEMARSIGGITCYEDCISLCPVPSGSSLRGRVSRVIRDHGSYPTCEACCEPLEEAKNEALGWGRKPEAFVFYEYGNNKNKKAKKSKNDGYSLRRGWRLRFLGGCSSDVLKTDPLFKKCVKRFDPRERFDFWHVFRSMPVSGFNPLEGGISPHVGLSTHSPISQKDKHGCGDAPAEKVEMSAYYSWTSRQSLVHATAYEASKTRSLVQRPFDMSVLAAVNAASELSECNGLIGNPDRRREEVNSQLWLRMRALSSNELEKDLVAAEPLILFWKSYLRYSTESCVVSLVRTECPSHAIQIVDTWGEGTARTLLRKKAQEHVHCHELSVPQQEGEEVAVMPPTPRYAFFVRARFAMDFMDGCPECKGTCGGAVFTSGWALLFYDQMHWVFPRLLERTLSNWTSYTYSARCEERSERMALPSKRLTRKEEKESEADIARIKVACSLETSSLGRSRNASRPLMCYAELKSFEPAVEGITLPRLIVHESLANKISNHLIGGRSSCAHAFKSHKSKGRNAQGLGEGESEEEEDLWLKEPMEFLKAVAPPCINAILSTSKEGKHPKIEGRRVLIMFLEQLVKDQSKDAPNPWLDFETAKEHAKKIWYKAFRRSRDTEDGVHSLSMESFYSGHAHGKEFANKIYNIETGRKSYSTLGCERIAEEGLCPFDDEPSLSDRVFIASSAFYGAPSLEEGGLDWFKGREIAKDAALVKVAETRRKYPFTSKEQGIPDIEDLLLNSRKCTCTNYMRSRFQDPDEFEDIAIYNNIDFARRSVVGLRRQKAKRQTPKLPALEVSKTPTPPGEDKGAL